MRANRTCALPDALDEFDLHLAPIKIAVEVQKMNLQERRTIVDGGPDAEAGDPGISFPSTRALTA